jgi:hypothetical protein
MNEIEINAAVTAYKNATYEWAKLDSDGRKEPLGLFAMRAAMAAVKTLRDAVPPNPTPGAMTMQTHLTIQMFDSADEAIKAGYSYRAPEFTGLQITKAIVVRNGTVEGNPTVDLLMEAPDGTKYVAMLTRRLLHSIPE